MKIISITGKHNSGKTTLIENIIEKLSNKGYSVGVLKHGSSKFQSDKEGTDTYKFAKSGAKGVGIFGDEKFMMIHNKSVEIDELLKFYEDYDICIIEGIKHSNYPKIEVVKDEFPVSSEPILAYVTDKKIKSDKPCFKRDDTNKIVEFIIEKIGDKVERKEDGIVLDVNISDRKGIVKRPVEEAEFKINHGIVGDAHAGDWHRQVSLLDKSSIDFMREKGLNLVDGDFAENITTDGIKLYELPIGTKLEIGETIQEVTQIGKECHKGCAIKNQVGECIMPTQGIFTKVIKEGKVKKGDKIYIIK